MPSIKRLSPEEMDKHQENAAIALKSLSKETIQTVADWWKQWYMSAGHKRLGRLLLTQVHNKSTNQDTKQISLYQGIKAHTTSSGLIFTFSEAPQDTSAMFSVEYQGAEIRIIINILHPAYSYLRGILIDSNVEQQDQTYSEIHDAVDGIKLLLIAWAKYECDQPQGTLHNRVKDTRHDWGRVGIEQIRQWELNI